MYVEIKPWWYSYLGSPQLCCLFRLFFLGPLQVPNTNHTSSWGLNYGEGGFHRFSQYAVFTYGCVTNRSVLNCTQTTTLGDNSMLSITFITAQNMWEFMAEHVRGMDKDKRTWFFFWNSQKSTHNFFLKLAHDPCKERKRAIIQSLLRSTQLADVYKSRPTHSRPQSTLNGPPSTTPVTTMSGSNPAGLGGIERDPLGARTRLPYS
jgi:hypothetical protein